MPIYEYECEECNSITPIKQSITDELKAEIPCGLCGKSAKKIISKCDFVLRGSGWPSKDFRRFGSRYGGGDD